MKLVNIIGVLRVIIIQQIALSYLLFQSIVNLLIHYDL